jgi:hypothetical protein
VRFKNVARVMPSDTTSRLLKEHFRVEHPYEQASMALDRARIRRDAQARAFLDLGHCPPVHYETEKYSVPLVAWAKGPAMSHAHERDRGVKGVARMIMYTECLNDLMRKNARW